MRDSVSSHSASLTLHCEDEAEAAAVAGAVGVEAREGLPKATARVAREADVVRVDVTARDAATLRAAVNSFLRWARVAEEAARAARR